jgi:hypothetical protein
MGCSKLDLWQTFLGTQANGLTGYSDDEDETAELQRELEKIKRERAEKREQEVCFPDKISSHLMCFVLRN